MEDNSLFFATFLIFTGAALFATVAMFARQALPLAYILLTFFLAIQGYSFSVIVAYLSDPRVPAGQPLELCGLPAALDPLERDPQSGHRRQLRNCMFWK